MAGFRISMLLMQVIPALVLIGLSIPLIRRMVAPNSWYGFRVRQTLGDPAVWYEANAYSGRCLLAAGIVIIIGSAILYEIPSIDGPTYAIACTLVSLVSVASAVVLSFRFLGRITRPTDL